MNQSNYKNVFLRISKRNNKTYYIIESCNLSKALEYINWYQNKHNYFLNISVVPYTGKNFRLPNYTDVIQIIEG